MYSSIWLCLSFSSETYNNKCPKTMPSLLNKYVVDFLNTEFKQNLCKIFCSQENVSLHTFYYETYIMWHPCKWPCIVKVTSPSQPFPHTPVKNVCFINKDIQFHCCTDLVKWSVAVDQRINKITWNCSSKCCFTFNFSPYAHICINTVHWDMILS